MQAGSASWPGSIQEQWSLSKVGIGLCVVYLAATAGCVFSPLGAEGDPKGQFVLLPLPIALQLGALDAIGFRPVLGQWSWAGAYTLVVPPSLAGWYGVGWLFARALRPRRPSPEP